VQHMWKTIETEHYVFHFQTDGLAESECQDIISTQERCFREITQTIRFFAPNKITYWLCNTRKDVGIACGLNIESNGITYCKPESPQIYAVYNDMKKCIGYHEDVHAIMCQYALPGSKAIEEGLAMHFDKSWWNIPNELCALVYQLDSINTSIRNLICENDFFYSVSDIISYPILGAFTSFLLKTYGVDLYMQIYQPHLNWNGAFETVYRKPLEEIEKTFWTGISNYNFKQSEIENAKKKLYQTQ